MTQCSNTGEQNEVNGIKKVTSTIVTSGKKAKKSTNNPKSLSVSQLFQDQ